MDEPSPAARARPDAGWVLTGVLAGAVVAMGAIAAARGWMPTGDTAFLSLRTRHLFPPDAILLNNASSGGPSAGSQYNHPGAFPLLLLAPITMIGGPGSVALATAVANAAWLALISVMVRRVAGARAQLGALVVAALLVWSMGATFLVDPWNPVYGMWPLAAAVVATWGVWRGSHRMLAIAVVAASVAFQTHLSLTATAGVLGVTAAVGARRARPSVWALGAVAGFVANAQMLWDQFFGTGNLGKMLTGAEFEESTVSARQVVAVLSSKLALPPWWGRGSWGSPVFPEDLPPTWIAAVALVAIAAVTAGAMWRCRHRAPAVTALLAVWSVALVTATAVSFRFPLRVGIPLPYFRWVWPMAAIWTAAIAAALIGGTRAGRRRFDRRLVGIASAAVVVIGGLAFVPANEELSPNPEWAQDIARPFAAAAVEELRDLDGAVLVEPSIQEAALWVVGGMIDQLDAAGIDVRVADRVLVQQTAEHYRATGDERAALVLRGGLDVDVAPDGGRLVARSDALDDAERRRLERLTRRLRPRLEARGAVRLTERGRSESDADQLEHLTTGEMTAEQLLRSVPLRHALERGAIEVAGVPRDELMAATRLGALEGGRTIALYLVPTPVS